uniref:Uncharacterized protein n=1 Tax=Megaselia scalaris TaxID=36166 RepID=T1GF62_MEGSC
MAIVISAVKRGTSQGGEISPLLWLFVANELFKALEKRRGTIVDHANDVDWFPPKSLESSPIVRSDAKQEKQSNTIGTHYSENPHSMTAGARILAAAPTMIRKGTIHCLEELMKLFLLGKNDSKSRNQTTKIEKKKRCSYYEMSLKNIQHFRKKVVLFTEWINGMEEVIINEMRIVVGICQNLILLVPETLKEVSERIQFKRICVGDLLVFILRG